MWYDLKKMYIKLFLQVFIFIVNLIVTFRGKLACFV